METGSVIKALYIVVNAGFTDEIMDIIRAAGGSGGTIIHARGEGSHHHLFMGITLDHEQEIIICLADMKTAEQIMESIKQKAGRNTDIRGICYVLPVERIIGLHQPESPDRE